MSNTTSCVEVNVTLKDNKNRQKENNPEEVTNNDKKINFVNNVTNKNNSKKLETMINNRTILEKSVEQKRNEGKPSRSQKDNMEATEKKNITRNLSFTKQEPIRMNIIENEGIDKDLGKIKIDINDRKNLTMYLNKKVANKLRLVAHLLLRI